MDNAANEMPATQAVVGPAPATDSRMWNRKNPAIRRILADLRELGTAPSDQYAAKPTEENMFEWHFCIRGPSGTDYQGGVYHGKILLPAEYPYKPPNIVFLTPNGRWETKTKICLSFSAYHPELWQPAWGVRTILEALISFMPTPGDGAVGAVEATADDRKRLARESAHYKHPLMPELPLLGSKPAGAAADKNPYAEQVAQLHFHAPNAEPGAASPAAAAAAAPAAPADAAPADATGAPIAAPQAPAMTVLGETVEMAESTTDYALRMSTWAVGVAIFLLGYRKLLTVLVPDMLM